MGTFIDLFAGCGGLSLGLMESGWTGLFAIERDELAFSTLKANLLTSRRRAYQWPVWLPKEPHDIGLFTRKYHSELRSLRGYVDLIAGGPPCQGFSYAGRRRSNDPRNNLFMKYLGVVGLVQPKIILLENVRGIASEFSKIPGELKNAEARRRAKNAGTFSKRIQRNLERIGYYTFPHLLRAADFGVPQIRPRFFMIGIRKDLLNDGTFPIDPFAMVDMLRARFLSTFGLKIDDEVTVRDAISDLRVRGTDLVECRDTKGYHEITYRGPKTVYQEQLHGRMNGHAPNSLRLAKHSEPIRKRFAKIAKGARPGISLSYSERKKFGVKKQHFVVLDANRPSHTLTTLPDDYLHYAEPRILTVREYARLQSFPDWFSFHGKYTTGGMLRVKQCPRYTQVGNAVPPRLARFLGILIKHYIRAHRIDFSASK